VFVEETRAAVQAVTEWQIVANTLMRVATAAAKATTAEDAPGHLTQPLSVQVMDVAAMMMSIRSLITTLTRQLAAHLAATVLLWGSCGSRMCSANAVVETIMIGIRVLISILQTFRPTSLILMFAAYLVVIIQRVSDATASRTVAVLSMHAPYAAVTTALV
jgi:hypothetical protein